MSKVSELKGNSDDYKWLNSKASLIRAVKILEKPSSIMVYDLKMNGLKIKRKKCR
jgi:hypothetical protein